MHVYMQESSGRLNGIRCDGLYRTSNRVAHIEKINCASVAKLYRGKQLKGQLNVTKRHLKREKTRCEKLNFLWSYFLKQAVYKRRGEFFFCGCKLQNQRFAARTGMWKAVKFVERWSFSRLAGNYNNEGRRLSTVWINSSIRNACTKWTHRCSWYTSAYSAWLRCADMLQSAPESDKAFVDSEVKTNNRNHQ